jgi:ABC-type branched-subunit amino acid transport system ATPase component
LEADSPDADRVRIYGVVALGLLSIGATAPLWALLLLAPQISTSIGASSASLGGARALELIATALGALAFAIAAQRIGRSTALILVGGLGSALTAGAAAVAGSGLTLLLELMVSGLAAGAALGLHAPLLTALAPPTRRGRSLSIYCIVGLAGQAGVAGLIAASGRWDISWRAVLLIVGAVELGAVVFALRLGSADDRASGLRDAGDLTTPDGIGLGFSERCRRVLLTPSVKVALAGLAALGAGTLPVYTEASYYLQHQWDRDPSSVAASLAIWFGSGIVALWLVAARVDRQFRNGPGRLLRAAGAGLVVAALAILVAGLSHPLVLALMGFAVSSVMVFGAFPLLIMALLIAVPVPMRIHAQAMAAAAGCLGALAQVVGASGFQSQYGLTGAVIALGLPLVAVGLLVMRLSSNLPVDIDGVLSETLDAQEISLLKTSGAELPLLRCSDVSFLYGQLQVLFDVNLTIREAEMVALLGVNGAGKSTLLKVISGICIPRSGSVRFDGADITHLDAERRVPIGISQIPGGRAVFGQLTVLENLRAFGYSLARSEHGVDRATDRCLEAFPRLYERRHSLASTLSGGEQQMLGLSKALVLRPRLLLIDELSLGLAPVIVAQLLDMVREINAAGTAVVLVEQSVNIALNLVDRAYFMEKGQIRFDGPSQELLTRDDLLRAVFLHGADAAGISE